MGTAHLNLKWNMAHIDAIVACFDKGLSDVAIASRIRQAWKMHATAEEIARIRADTYRTPTPDPNARRAFSRDATASDNPLPSPSLALPGQSKCSPTRDVGCPGLSISRGAHA